MQRAYAFLLCFFLTAGCADKPQNSEANFIIHSSRNRDLIPENVILDISNLGDLPLCIPIAETRVDLGKMKLIPDIGENPGNRPPPIMMSGLDISEGLYVIPPKKDRRIFVNIGSSGSSSHILRGVVRASVCRDIFSGNVIKIVEKPFSQTL